MKKPKEFPFERARRISESEVHQYRKAIEEKLGKQRPVRGRPPKTRNVKFQPISIRLHPLVLEWAKKEARRRGIGYQTIINQVLMEKAAA